MMPKLTFADYQKMAGQGKRKGKRKARGRIQMLKQSLKNNVVQQSGGGGASGLAPGLEKQMPMFHNILWNKNRAQRLSYIDQMNNAQMLGVKRLTKSFLRNKYELNPKVLKDMKKQAKYYYSLADNRVPNTLKKNILKQKGGVLFAPLIAKIAPALISSLAKPILEKTLGSIL